MVALHATRNFQSPVPKHRAVGLIQWCRGRGLLPRQCARRLWRRRRAADAARRPGREVPRQERPSFWASTRCAEWSWHVKTRSAEEFLREKKCSGFPSPDGGIGGGLVASERVLGRWCSCAAQTPTRRSVKHCLGAPFTPRLAPHLLLTACSRATRGRRCLRWILRASTLDGRGTACGVAGVCCDFHFRSHAISRWYICEKDVAFGVLVRGVCACAPHTL